jgi:hypothetical protein
MGSDHQRLGRDYGARKISPRLEIIVNGLRISSQFSRVKKTRDVGIPMLKRVTK